MPPLTVSVIIPAHQAAATIGRAIGSVLVQSSQADEIIVVDDGSTDELVVALGPYEGRITLIHQENEGAGSARNRGIQRAAGDLVAFLDADDYWEGTKLERQLAVFEGHPELGIVAGSYFEAWPGGSREVRLTKRTEWLDRPVRVSGETAFELAMVLWTGTVVVRRELLAENRFDPALATAQDRDLWIRLVSTNAVFFISEPLATYVQRADSNTQRDVERDCVTFLKVVRRYPDLLGPGGLRRWEAAAFRRWAGNHLARGDAGAALTPAWQRLVREPLCIESWRIVAKCWLRALMASTKR